MSHRALCVGINDYPGTNMDLGGCVNDARDWQALLEARGYRVDPLHDGEATRARIIDALTSIIGSATEGDSVVFMFAGHGSWLPDANGDEADARDEMMCPVDVMQEQYLLDDDLNKIFCAKRAGVRLYVIADSCHSGSVIRYAPSPDGISLKARFLPPYAFARGNVRLERAIDRAASAPAPRSTLTRRCCSRDARTASSATTRRSVAARMACSREPPSTCCRTPALPRRGRSMTRFENSSLRSRIPKHLSSLDPRRHNWVLSSDP
jgi:hypothetical protein